MQKDNLIPIPFIVFLVVSWCSVAGVTALDLKFGEAGLAELRLEGHRIELADETLPRVRRVRVTDEYRDKCAEARAALLGKGREDAPYVDGRNFEDADAKAIDEEFDAADHRLSRTYEWGKVHADYSISNERLDIDVTVENKSDSVVEFLAMDLIALELGDEVEFEKKPHNNIEAPTVLEAFTDDLKVVLANRQPDRPLRLQWKRDGGRLIVGVRAGHPDGGAEVHDGVWNVRPIDRDETDTYRISLFFGAEADSKIELAREVYDAFHEAYPPVSRWYDRRPIGTLFLAGYHEKTEQNPRRYTVGGFPVDGDVHSEEGRENLRKCLMDYADQVIETAESMGLQGVIAWDLEGGEYAHPTTYLGAPRMLPLVAPEMDELADDFFDRLDEAGLRTGVTIRPTLLWPVDEEGDRIDDWDKRAKLRHRPWLPEETYEEVYADIDAIEPEEMDSPVERLSNKIAYVKERWGCTLIYVDTPHLWRPRERTDGINEWSSKQVSAQVFEEVARRHPDVVIIPEHSYPRYRASTAPYYQIGYSPLVTPPEIRAIYPEGFVFQNMANEPDTVTDKAETFIEGVRKGDSFLVHGWWGGQTSQTRLVFSIAAALAPNKVSVHADGMSVNGESVSDARALADYFREELDADMPLTRRRVFVSYDDALDPGDDLRPVLDRLMETEAVIAWVQPDSEEGFWGADNPFHTGERHSEAFIRPGSDGDEDRIVVITNASTKERVVSVEIDYNGLGLGVDGLGDVIIGHLDKLAPESEDLPDEPPNEVRLGEEEEDDREADDLMDDLGDEIEADAKLMDQNRDDFEFTKENYWLNEDGLEVLVGPESYRVLHIRAR